MIMVNILKILAGKATSKDDSVMHVLTDQRQTGGIAWPCRDQSRD